ncbi:hypothetical protein BJ878DRAFT_541668 [Calycina marina]|uniref:Membrane anchor Opy2 N-terminal domain-containing protein n=1 Tax=Calycina marina TaxID=1763456 RepID=A0A9P8CFP7_9HELO|nr:hypothetical protein BJ878DRAFT_541668 [Calycina marina]
MAFYGAVSESSLFRRCVTGCPDESPDCPDCATDEICALVPRSCDECQKTECITSTSVSTPTSTASPSSSSKPNVSIIASSVVAGVVVVVIATYLVWRFCVKNRRQQYAQEAWTNQDAVDSTSTEKDFAGLRDARVSTHTVGSVASSVLTRASNIIQIAYIPGVTNRSVPSSPGILVPPVPPIPIALSSPSSSPRYEHERFFMPGDLRDSTYSGMSDRTSYARNSVASTIYGKNAIVSPTHAQTVMRGKAAVVSVKGTPSGELTPPVPSIDYNRYTTAPSSPAFSVGSTFLNHATAAKVAMKPQVINVAIGPGPKKNAVYELDAAPNESLLGRHDSNAITIIDDTPNIEQGLFSDNAVKTSLKGKRTSSSTDSYPFGDEHELKE